MADDSRKRAHQTQSNRLAASKMGATAEAERVARLERMRSHVSQRRDQTGKSLPREGHQDTDVEKLVRTRLVPDEIRTLRAAWMLFCTSKNNEVLKTKKLWSVMRALGQAPTPTEFAKLVKECDKRGKGVVRWPDFLKEMERWITQYFSKPNDIRRAFQLVTRLTGEDNGLGTVTIDELTIAMENLGFKLSDDPDEAEEEVFEMIGEVDSKGMGEIDSDDFVKMLAFVIKPLPGEGLS